MEETSVFFAPGEDLPGDEPGDIQRIYESNGGYTMLSKTTLDGKVVVLKSLKPEFAGNPFMRACCARSMRSGVC